MHETNGELMERNDKYKLSDNMFNDALVVISNLIARATTKWTLEETKLFLCSVSRIKTRNKECWVTMSKRDIAEKLEIDPTNRSKMRDMFKISSSEFNSSNQKSIEYNSVELTSTFGNFFRGILKNGR